MQMQRLYVITIISDIGMYTDKGVSNVDSKNVPKQYKITHGRTSIQFGTRASYHST